MKKLFCSSLCILFLFFSGCFSPEIIHHKKTSQNTPQTTENTQQYQTTKTDIQKKNYKQYIPTKILEKSFYEKAFSVTEKKFPIQNAPPHQTNILIVNHHLLAPHFIADTLRQISPQQKETIQNIILLSPNHFHQGKYHILSSNLPFKTPYGFLDTITSNTQQNTFGINIDNTVMKNEHGITGIVGFIHKYFLENTSHPIHIFPIILDDKTSTEESKHLAENIYKHFSTKDTLVIISMDMSHDLFPQIAQFHDTTTLQALQTQDENTLPHIDTDSRPSLLVLFRLAKYWNQTHFTLTHHSNSAQITHQKYQPDTTSYITGFFTKNNTPQTTHKITALFFGDMMLDRYIRQQLNQKGWESILNWRMKRFMTGSDFTVINFEGAMTNNTPYKAHDNMMAFTSDPKWAKKMHEYGINIANLANNHSFNFGKKGFLNTKKFLAQYNIATFGTPYNNTTTGNISTIQEVRGIKIAFIGYHELFSGNTKPITEEIKRIKHHTLADFIIVYAHWGDEYLQKIHPRIQRKAHTFIDAGADIVIGHHPHVIEPMEIYKKKYIFYSLGNFVFDQVWKPSVRTRLGLGITFLCTDTKITCYKKQIQYTLFPLIADKNKTHNFKVELMDKKNQETFFSWFQSISNTEQ